MGHMRGCRNEVQNLETDISAALVVKAVSASSEDAAAEAVGELLESVVTEMLVWNENMKARTEPSSLKEFFFF